MNRTNDPEVETTGSVQKLVGSFLFLALFLFLWIGISPFVDLTGTGVFEPSAGRSNRLNQIILLLLFFSILSYGLSHSMRNTILQPRLLLAAIFVWFLFTSIFSQHPANSVKGVVIAILAMVNASIFLLLPASERHFAKLLGISALLVVGLAYYGVVFKPTLAIHQASELREPMNAGLWRGHFPHKNSAAAAMVLFAFFGLFVMKRWSRMIGLLITVAAAFFLFKTGGKTSTAMLPVTIAVAWLFQRYRLLRIPIAVGGVAAFNLLAIGSAVIKPLGDFVASLGIDATFTHRADIWNFAFTAISEKPIIGYGLRSFWQTEELVYGGGSIETWAAAAENGHNSYLDIALAAGFPGLFLVFLFVVIFPLRNFSKLTPETVKSPLTSLYVRIWLYTLFSAGLESVFFEGGNLLWFSFTIAAYGLFLQSTAQLEPEVETVSGERLSHA